MIFHALKEWAQASEHTASSDDMCRVVPETIIGNKQATLIMQVKKEDLNNNFDWISYLLQSNNTEFAIRDVIWDEGRF